jgi:hypothetical protein
MGIPSSAASRADVSLEERTSIELVRLVNKLRWIGMDEEAEQVQEVLRAVDPAATLLAGPWETD